MLQIALMNI